MAHKNRAIKLVILFALSFNVCSAGIFEVAGSIGLGVFYSEIMLRIVKFRSEARARENVEKAKAHERLHASIIAAEKKHLQERVHEIREILYSKLEYSDVLDAKPMEMNELIENFFKSHRASLTEATASHWFNQQVANLVIQSRKFLALREAVVDKNQRNKLQAQQLRALETGLADMQAAIKEKASEAAVNSQLQSLSGQIATRQSTVEDQIKALQKIMIEMGTIVKGVPSSDSQVKFIRSLEKRIESIMRWQLQSLLENLYFSEQQSNSSSTTRKSAQSAFDRFASIVLQSDAATQAQIKRLSAELAQLRDARSNFNESIEQRVAPSTGGSGGSGGADTQRHAHTIDSTAPIAPSKRKRNTESSAQKRTTKSIYRATTHKQIMKLEAELAQQKQAMATLATQVRESVDNIQEQNTEAIIASVNEKARHLETQIVALEDLIKQLSELSVSCIASLGAASAATRSDLINQLKTLKSELISNEAQFKINFEKQMAEYNAALKKAATESTHAAPQSTQSATTAAAPLNSNNTTPLEITQRIAALETELHLLLTKVTSPAEREQIAPTQAELATLKQQLSELQTRSETFASKLNLRDAMIGYDTDFRSICAKVQTEHTNFITERSLQIERALKPIVQFREQIQSVSSVLNKQLEEIRTQMDANASDAKAAIEKQANDSSAALSAAQATQTKANTEALAAKEKELVAQIEEVRNLISRCNGVVSTLQSGVTALRTTQSEQYARLVGAQETATAERAKLREELDALKANNSPNHLAQLMAQTSERLAETRTTIMTEMTTIREQISRELSTQNERLSEQEAAQNRKLEDEIAKMRAELTEANATQLAAFAKRLDEIQAAYTAQQTTAAQNEATEKAFAELRKQIAAETAARIALSDTVEQHTTLINGLNERVTIFDATLNRLTGRIEVCEEHRAMQIKLNEEFAKKTDLELLRAQLGGLEGLTTRMQTAFDAQTRKLEKEKEECETRYTTFEAQTTANAALNGTLSAELNEGFSRINKEQAKQDGEIAALQQNHETYNQTHARLRQALDAAQATAGGRITECPHCIIAKLAKRADAQAIKDMMVPLTEREAELARKAAKAGSKGTSAAASLYVSPASTPGHSRSTSRRSSIATLAPSPSESKSRAESKATGESSTKSKPNLACATHSAIAAANCATATTENSGSSTSSPALSPAVISGSSPQFNFDSGSTRPASCPINSSATGKKASSTHSKSASAPTSAASVGLSGFGSVEALSASAAKPPALTTTSPLSATGSSSTIALVSLDSERNISPATSVQQAQSSLSANDSHNDASPTGLSLSPASAASATPTAVATADNSPALHTHATRDRRPWVGGLHSPSSGRARIVVPQASTAVSSATTASNTSSSARGRGSSTLSAASTRGRGTTLNSQNAAHSAGRGRGTTASTTRWH